jgi:hypothetical protein
MFHPSSLAGYSHPTFVGGTPQDDYPFEYLSCSFLIHSTDFSTNMLSLDMSSIKEEISINRKCKLLDFPVKKTENDNARNELRVHWRTVGILMVFESQTFLQLLKSIELREKLKKV